MIGAELCKWMAGCESHAGQVFVCVAALELAGSLHLVDGDLLSWWYVGRAYVQH